MRVYFADADFHHTHIKRLVDLFVAEGILASHSLLYGSKEKMNTLLTVMLLLLVLFTARRCTQRLPKPYNDSSMDAAKATMGDLKIAWRYERAIDPEVTVHSFSFYVLDRHSLEPWAGSSIDVGALV